MEFYFTNFNPAILDIEHANGRCFWTPEMIQSLFSSSDKDGFLMAFKHGGTLAGYCAYYFDDNVMVVDDIAIDSRHRMLLPEFGEVLMQKLAATSMQRHVQNIRLYVDERDVHMQAFLRDYDMKTGFQRDYYSNGDGRVVFEGALPIRHDRSIAGRAR